MTPTEVAKLEKGGGLAGTKIKVTPECPLEVAKSINSCKKWALGVAAMHVEVPRVPDRLSTFTRWVSHGIRAHASLSKRQKSYVGNDGT